MTASSNAPVQPSLERTLIVRLAITAVLAILLQLVIVAARSYLDHEALLISYVSSEAKAIGRNVQFEGRGISFDPKTVPSRYRGRHSDAYAFRILDADGRTIAEHNGERLLALSPWQSQPSENQDLWLRDLDQQQRMFVAGGHRQRHDGHEIWVEVMTTGDPSHAFLSILGLEILDDVWLPMIPLIVLSLGVAIWSVRKSLRPLTDAAAKANALSPTDIGRQFDAAALPREIAGFVTAINKLLERAKDLVGTQRLFIARAAHELRTPLSVLLIEFSRIDDPRVRRLESDVRTMSELVNQLLMLARLESAEPSKFETFDLAEVAHETVRRLEILAQQSGHNLSLVLSGRSVVAGDRSGLREALRNLVENAIKHTPKNTEILVGVGPGGCFVVEDGGPGMNEADVQTMLQPFQKGRSSQEGAGLGLAIVNQAAELHRGKLTVGRSSLGGARFELRIPQIDREQAADCAGAQQLVFRL